MLVDPRPGLRAHLLADPAIAAIVGDRIYPVHLPQGMRAACIVYNRVSEIETTHSKGPSALVSTRFQFDAVSASVDEACALADAVKERLGGFAGAITYAPGGVLNVGGILFDNGRDAAFEGDLDLYQVSRDFIVWYAERN